MADLVRRIRKRFLALLGAAAPIAGGLAAAYGAQHFPRFLLGTFAVLALLDAVLADELLDQVPRLAAVKDRVAGAMAGGAPGNGAGNKIRKAFGKGLAAVAGAACALALWVAVDQVRGSGGCAPPAEVRVMAAAENLAAARQAAESFADDREGPGACAAVRLTVFQGPGPGKAESVFDGRWDLSERPHPDVWLPATSAVTGAVAAETSARVLEASRRAGSASPLVLAVPKRVADDLGVGGSSRIGWADLADRLAGESTELVLPDPEATESGLAAVHALFAGAPGSGGDAPQRRRELMRMVNRSGPVPADPDAALCRLEDLVRSGKRTVAAAIVPEDSVDRHRRPASAGGPCGKGRLGEEEALVQVRPADGTPGLDRPVVRVVWRDGGEDAARSRLAEEFARSLARSGLRREPGVPGDPFTTVQLRRAQEQVAEAREPLVLDFMIDMSGTMNAPATGGTLMANAHALVGDALDRLGPGDRVGLWRFPASGDGRDPARLVRRAAAVPAQVGRVRSRLAGLRRADAGTTPLYHAIAGAARERAPRRALVVLTDGENDDPGHDDAFTRDEELEDALDEAGGPEVYVVVLKDGGCPKELASIEKSTPRFHCLDLEKTDGRLLHGLLSELTR